MRRRQGKMGFHNWKKKTKRKDWTGSRKGKQEKETKEVRK